MYIKLNNLNLKYHQETNDWFIVSEIPDTGMSYEKPILVRTTDELDIWFGKDFPDHDYMTELLNQGIVLYLYKPVLTDIISSSDDFVDLSLYTRNPDAILVEDELDFVTEILKNPLKYKFYHQVVENGELVIKTEGFTRSRTTPHILSTTQRGIDSKEYYNENFILRKELPDIISAIDNAGQMNVGFGVYGSDNMWIFHNDEIVDTTLLSQNIDKVSSSLNNRDVLILGTPNSQIGYSYSDFDNFSEEIKVIEDKNIVNFGKQYVRLPDLPSVNMESISNNYSTMVFRLEGDINDGDYIILPYVKYTSNKGKGILFYKGNEPNIDNRYWFVSYQMNSVSDIIGHLNEYGGYYTIVDNGNTYIISPMSIPVTYFLKSDSLKFISYPDITQKILSEAIISEDTKIVNPGMYFWSKTIGRCSRFDDNENIRVTIEKSDSRNYRFTITRFDYTETFEGLSEVLNPGEEERIDNIINRESKLVRCRIENPNIRLGTFTLRGGSIETNTPDMYQFSLDKMFDESSESVYPDYFLVYDKYKYTISNEIDPNSGYLSIYDKFLDYAKNYDCQFLIENIDTNVKLVSKFPESPEEGIYYKIDNSYYKYNSRKWQEIISNEDKIDKSKIIVVTELPEKPQEDIYYKLNDTYYTWKEISDEQFIYIGIAVEQIYGDYTLNYTGDTENRLLYFYRGFNIFNLNRPAYYVYLYGLLNDTYSFSTNYLLYDTPTDPYDDIEKIEPTLERYKSNYLICNNQTYYYKKYQNGEDYITTGWMRFVAGKISRELQKHKWNYIGQQLLGKVRTAITNILWEINKSYSIIKSISLTRFEPDLQNNAITLEIETYVNDLVNNHLKLDITVDYNNINSEN